MTCQQLVDLLPELVSGELDAQAHDAVHQHLDSCPSCHTYIQTYQLVMGLTRQLPPLPLPTHFAQRLEQLLQQLGDFRHRPH